MSSCGCKGVRTCLLCEQQNKAVTSKPRSPKVHRKDLDNQDAWMASWKCIQPKKMNYDFCTLCGKVYASEIYMNQSEVPVENSLSHAVTQLTDFKANQFNPSNEYKSDRHLKDQQRYPKCHHRNEALSFSGVEVIEDFVSPSEEEALVKAMEESPFAASQSGRHKQDFGPQVNFKKQKIKSGKFTGLPSYSRLLYERMKGCLENFEPVEMCNLEYCCERGSHIDPHIDDQWVWGERLVTLNLLSDSTLTFCHPGMPGVFVRVPLTRRSLLVVKDEARHKWKHLIDPSDVRGRRLAMTFRELTLEFMPGGQRADEGAKLLKVALSFKGFPVGTAVSQSLNVPMVGVQS